MADIVASKFPSDTHGPFKRVPLLCTIPHLVDNQSWIVLLSMTLICEIRILASQDDSSTQTDVEASYRAELTLHDRNIRATADLTINASEVQMLSSNPGAYGRSLGKILFANNELGDVFGQALAVAKEKNEPLGVRLRIDSTGLSTLRWERVFAPLDDAWQPLGIAADTPFARFVPPVAQWQAKKAPSILPLRMLVVIASPGDLTEKYQLDAIDNTERAKLRTLLDGLSHLDVTYLESDTDDPPTLNRLQQVFNQGVDLVHVLCHGARTRGGTVLYLEKEDGSTDPVETKRLIATLDALPTANRPLLCFLAACETAHRERHDAFVPLGPSLAADGGVRAVVAMSERVGVETAQRFTYEFYKRFLFHGVVDLAVNEARAIVKEEWDWSAPVLFLHTLDGTLLDIPKPFDRSAWLKRIVRISGAILAAILTVLAGYQTLRDVLCEPPVRSQIEAVCAVVAPQPTPSAAIVISVTPTGHPSPSPTPTLFPAQVMTGDFNIAVAALSAPESSESGKVEAVADELYKKLKNAMAVEISPKFSVDVWPPNKIGSIVGVSEEDQIRAAIEKTGAIGADLLVFGILDTDIDQTILRPRFYISSTQLVFAEEAAGLYDLGEEIVVEGNIIANPIASEEMRDLIADRASALASFTLGLGHYARHEFLEAIPYFERARASTEWTDTRWRQIVLLFLGSAAAQLDQLPEAQAYYSQALKLDESYARAQLAIGQIQFLRNRGSCQADDSNFNANAIQGAIDNYDTAVEKYDAALKLGKSDLADIPIKAALFEGSAAICLGFAAGMHSEMSQVWLDSAEEKFEQVLREYEESGNERLKYLAAEASGRLGLLHLLIGVLEKDDVELLEQAETEFNGAVALSRRDDRRAYFRLRGAEAVMRLGDCILASDYLAEEAEYYLTYRQEFPWMPQVPGYEKDRQEINDSWTESCSSQLTDEAT